MVYPVAGVIVWIILGSMVGLLVGKWTSTDDSKGVMANIGVGSVAAVIAGFVTSLFFAGEKSNGGFWGAVVIALVASCIAVPVFRMVFPKEVPTLR